MRQRTCVALARADSEFYKLEAQQRAVILGLLAQARHRKLLELAVLLKKVIDAHFASVLPRINLLAGSIDGSCQFLGRLRRVS
jgi:hypothetical protein